MMISAQYPKETIDCVVNAIDNAIDFDAVGEEDMDVLRHFLISLRKLTQQEGVMICKPGDYARMSDNEDLLNSLKGAGVDNWEGYDFALEDYWANKED